MIGSRAWMQLSQGRLSFKEKIQLANQVLLPSALAFSKTIFLKSPAETSLKYAHIRIPDTAIVKDAVDELHSTAQPSIVMHSWRCYYWGVAIAHTKDWQFDEESFAVACLMHDLGLNPNSPETCQCFTLASALKAEQLCVAHDYPKDRMTNISNSICLHINGYLDETDNSLSKEVLLMQKATACDVIGTDLHRIGTAFQNEVLQQFPRQQFNQQFRQILKNDAQRRPDSRSALLCKLGLQQMIQMNPFTD